MSINTCSPRLGVRPPSVRLEQSSSLPAPVRKKKKKEPSNFTCSHKNTCTRIKITESVPARLLISYVLESTPPLRDRSQCSQYRPPRWALTADSTESTHTSMRKPSAMLPAQHKGKDRQTVAFHMLVHGFSLLDVEFYCKKLPVGPTVYRSMRPDQEDGSLAKSAHAVWGALISLPVNVFGGAGSAQITRFRPCGIRWDRKHAPTGGKSRLSRMEIILKKKKSTDIFVVIPLANAIIWFDVL